MHSACHSFPGRWFGSDCAYALEVRGFSKLSKKVPVTRTGSLGDHDGTQARKYFSRSLQNGPSGVEAIRFGGAEGQLPGNHAQAYQWAPSGNLTS